MSNFVKYPSLKRLGQGGTHLAMTGKVYFYSKIDGSNSSCWLENGEIQAGSRNNHLSATKDNAGFWQYVQKDERLKMFFCDNDDRYRLYGEFLVPHTLRTYEEDAWRKFYIFDIMDNTTGEFIEIDEDFCKMLEKTYGLDVIPPLAVIDNPTHDQIQELLDTNTYLVTEGVGEGIVCKNFDFRNKHGEQVFAKVISESFKNGGGVPKKPRIPKDKTLVAQIANEFLTLGDVNKEIAKLTIDQEWDSKLIGQLMANVWNSFIDDYQEEILTKYADETIDFKSMRTIVCLLVKELRSDLF